jgi:hypothetical protein
MLKMHNFSIRIMIQKLPLRADLLAEVHPQSAIFGIKDIFKYGITN